MRLRAAVSLSDRFNSGGSHGRLDAAEVAPSGADGGIASFGTRVQVCDSEVDADDVRREYGLALTDGRLQPADAVAVTLGRL